MKKLVTLGALSALTFALATDVASARDGNATWQGCFVGTQASASAGATNMKFGSTPFSVNLPKTAGTLVGAQAGCDVQRGRFVFGGAIEGSAGKVSGSGTYGYGVAVGLDYSRSLAISARAGFLVKSKLLIYGRLGYSGGNATLKTASYFHGPLTQVVAKGIIKGPFVGIGAEYRWRQHVSLFAEVRRYDLSTTGSVFSSPVTFTNQATSIVAGLNYRF